eukprot:gene5473-9291_t
MSLVKEITNKCKEALTNDKSNQKVEALKNYLKCLELSTKALKSLQSQNPQIVGKDLENIVFISKQSLDRVNFLYLEMPEENRKQLIIEEEEEEEEEEDYNLENYSSFSSSIQTSTSNDSPSTMEESEDKEDKFDQATIRIQEIEKVNQKLEKKLKLASKEQANAIKKQILQNNAVKEYYSRYINILPNASQKPKKKERQNKKKSHRKSFAAKIKESFSTKKKEDDPWTKFIEQFYHYDKISSKLKIADEEFIGNLPSHKDDHKYIKSNIFKMLNDKDHALHHVCDAFYLNFKDTFQLQGVAWCNINDALLDIHLFSEKLALKITNQWENSFLNSEFGKQSCEETVLLYIAMRLFDHIFSIYRMQDDNKVREKQIEKLFEITLEDLNVKPSLLLSNEVDPYSNAIYSLNEIFDQRNPSEMIKIISRTTNSIYQSISDYNNIDYTPEDSEELLPVFLYVVIRANVPELPSYLNFITDFGDLTKFDTMGEYGLSMFISSLTWSLNIEPPQKWSIQTPQKLEDNTFDVVPPVDDIEYENEYTQEERQEEFDQQTFDYENTEEYEPPEDDGKSQYIKELEVEIDELYKELTKHMEIEQSYESEIHELKLKIKKLEKELKEIKQNQSQNNSPVKSISIPTNPQPKPLELSPRIESRAITKLLPFCVTIHESLDIKFEGKNLKEYKVIGQIGVQGYSKNQESDISSVDNHEFSLHLTDISKITSALNNPKYCKKVENLKNSSGISLECKVPSSDLFSNNKFQNAVLMKYNLKEGDVLLPIKIQPLYKMNKGNIELIINFTINPRFDDKNPLDNLTIRAFPLIKEKSTGNIISTKKCVSKPDNEFNDQKQVAEWKFQTAKSKSDGSPEKILAKFFTMNENLGDCDLSMNFIVQFQCSGVSLGEVAVDGCSGKKSISDEIFVGGTKQKIVFANMNLNQ